MTTNNNSVSVPASALSVDALVKAGIVQKVTKDSVNKARAIITQEGGFVPADASDALLLTASSVVTNAKAAAKAGRAASLSLAMIDDSEEYKRVNDAYGKPFKSANMLFKALFPSLADSTVRNYLNVGKAIYLPAMRGELPADLMILNTLEPGTALSVVGALNDSEVRAALPAAIKDAVNGGKLSQSGLKNAVKVAKEAVNKGKSDGTLTTATKANKDAHAVEVEELRAALAKAFVVDKTADELHLSLDLDSDEQGMTVVNKILKDASKDGDAASLFVESFKAFLNAYSK